MKRTQSTSQWSGYAFVFPSAATLVALVAYPLIYGVYISLFKTNLLNKWNFVGLKYYLQAFSSAKFLQTLVVTFEFTAFTVIGHFLIGILLASVLNMKLPGRTIFRAILLAPWLFPEVVVGLLWKWMLNSMYGIFNHFLMSLQITTEPISWLGNPTTALAAVVLVAIWKGYPLVMLLLLAGLQAIPEELYEAAEIDGASRGQVFRFVTLPGLKSILIITLILDTVWWFKHFTLIWILTQGGPVNATNVVSINIFKAAFESFRFGPAAAMAVIVFFICFGIGYVYRRILGDDDD